MTRNTFKLLTSLAFCLSLALLPACGGGSQDDHGHDGDTHAGSFAEVSKAICVLQPTTGTELTNVKGVVTLTQTKDGLLIVAKVTGLKPNSKHGFHIHQWGDITDSESAKTSGPHFNPEDKPHSLPGEGHMHGDTLVHMTGGHAGGLGNLETDENGNATFSKTFENISLKDKHAVLGRSFIVHIDEDDGKGESGNAGPRVAQGVIGIANPEAE